MSEYFVVVDLTTPPTVPKQILETIGVPITGVIVNGPLPVGLTLKVCRNGTGDGIVVGGATSPTGGGDALLDFFCPPIFPDGAAVLWDVPAPGVSARLVFLSNSGGEAARA